MHNIREKVAWAIAGVLALFVVISVTGVVQGGPLDPPAAPAPTGATLIFQPANCAGFPILIDKPGSYKLAQNITGCGPSGINITTGGVTLDLGGFSLEGTGSNNGIVTAVGIGMRNIIVRNGTVRNWTTGVRLLESAGDLVEDIVAADNSAFGIDVGGNAGAPNVVHHVIARANGTAQIRMAGGVLRDSAVEGGQYGILAFAGSLVINNSVAGASVHGIEADASRIEANDVSGSTIGYYAGIVGPPNSSLFIGNGARNNGTEYSIGAGNSYGAILAPAGLLPNSDPHANFSY